MSIEKHWYVVKVVVGREDGVSKQISSLIPEIDTMVPTEVSVRNKSGKPSVYKKKSYPGYIIVNVPSELKFFNDIENVEGVYGFLGYRNTKTNIPAHISEKEMEDMINNTIALENEFSYRTTFVPGMRIKIVSGPFISFFGTVDSVHEDKVRVSISVFDNPTLLDLDYLELEKVS